MSSPSRPPLPGSFPDGSWNHGESALLEMRARPSLGREALGGEQQWCQVDTIQPGSMGFL